MDALYEKYKNLKIDGSWIGLEPGEETPYFCTPIGAEIIGWDNGIHYCFIEDFGDIICFAFWQIGWIISTKVPGEKGL